VRTHHIPDDDLGRAGLGFLGLVLRGSLLDTSFLVAQLQDERMPLQLGPLQWCQAGGVSRLLRTIDTRWQARHCGPLPKRDPHRDTNVQAKRRVDIRCADVRFLIPKTCVMLFENKKDQAKQRPFDARTAVSISRLKLRVRVSDKENENLKPAVQSVPSNLIRLMESFLTL
jgi:hypothetical protein